MTEQSPLTKDQLAALMLPIHSSRVKELKKGGRGFSYVEAYDIRATLIRVFGFGGFSIDVLESTVQSVERDIPKSSGGTTAFRITATARVRLSIPQLGCTYTETAAANQSGSEPGEVMDFAIKTAASDALKRCGANLGTQFGLSLYNNGSRAEVIQVLYSPEQGPVWSEIAEERSAESEAAQARVQGVIDQGTGQ